MAIKAINNSTSLDRLIPTLLRRLSQSRHEHDTRDANACTIGSL
jgi:hypothetical protein